MMNKILSRLIFAVTAILFATDIMAQVPQGFNFQAVARDAEGELITNEELGVRISVVQGSEDGTVVYTETQKPTTNEGGAFQLVIGDGTTEDDFMAVEWGNDNYYVKLEIDPAGGTEYEELGVTRLLSVPYALVSQNVVNGISVGEEIITEYHLNSSQGDTSFIVNATGATSLAGIQSTASTESFNRGVVGRAISTSSNTFNQYGLQGHSNGDGTGAHIGVMGNAASAEATSGNRYGVYGQATSKAKYNYGVSGYSYGPGNGDEGTDVGEGSINFGVRGGAVGNTWNNTGLEAQASGEDGKWNFGVHGLSSAGSADTDENHGVAGRASGPGKNYGVYGAAWDGVENYAGYFDGNTVVNGDLTVNGTINSGDFDSGSSNISAENENGDIVGTLSSSDPNNKQGFLHLYGETEAETDDLRAALEVSENENGESWGSLHLKGPVEHRDFVEAGVSNNPDGADPSGWSGFLNLWGNDTPNIFMGSQDWENVELPHISLTGSIPNNDDWFYDQINIGVSKDGDQEWGSMVFRANEEVINVEIGAKHWLDPVNGAGLPYMAFRGNTPDEDMIYVEVSDDGSNEFGNIHFNSSDGAHLSINAYGVDGELNVNGDLNYTGSLNNTSDRNLKENIQPLNDGLSTIMKLNPTTYNFRGNGDYNGLKLSTGLHYGLIAQEVEEVLPSLVKNNVHTYSETESESMSGPGEMVERDVTKTMEYKTMNYTELIPVLIKGMQEQQAEIERLQKELEELKKNR